MGLRFKDYPKFLLQGRYYPPAHFTLKIESFSLMVKSSIHEYISNKFRVGGYDWKLHIHPNGKTDKGGNNCISLYIEVVDTASLPPGWEINAVINFFVYDHIRHMYYTIPASDSKVVCFHPFKRQWGISRFIGIDTFNSSNGYLVDDQCVFGTEVMIIEKASKEEFLFLLEENANFSGSYIWKIKSFDCLLHELYESDTFTSGDFKWKSQLYPQGYGDGKGNSISVFLCLDESTLPKDSKVYVKYKFCLLNKDQNLNFVFIDYLYIDALSLSCGRSQNMGLDKLQDAANGFLVDDSCSIEVYVTILGMVKNTST
ncbi:MATH domain and coiled-coil domain-containing protein At1g31390-like [Impatiens glandulifera]|uniref:MATH domain and coiled-coil domain-containing protein At1g31390-like n=1 Tax=Impatiens glandulifera TaxID=253017 RepID=UPI001FB196C6|nr:MATH domain and coiled-coil domain-containing protein At1g31390-like [Impatiens glandulifera]